SRSAAATTTGSAAAARPTAALPARPIEAPSRAFRSSTEADASLVVAPPADQRGNAGSMREYGGEQPDQDRAHKQHEEEKGPVDRIAFAHVVHLVIVSLAQAQAYLAATLPWREPARGAVRTGTVSFKSFNSTFRECDASLMPMLAGLRP